MLEILQYDFMQRALLAALLVGCAAPTVGVFLVQRQLSLIGDGIGHVALSGVAIGVLTHQQPVWTALGLTVVAAVAVELIRSRGRTNGDVALAIMFYGGIALGVVLMSKAPGGGVALNSYLFGAITTTTRQDLTVFLVLAVLVIGTTWLLRPRLFAVANDEEYARAVGLPVLPLNLALAILTAVTVVVSMRVVGLLLISALMIVPNAASQILARSFRSMMGIAVIIGLACSVSGVGASFYLDTPSGGTIVVLAILVFLTLATGSALRDALATHRRRPATPRDASTDPATADVETPGKRAPSPRHYIEG